MEESGIRLRQLSVFLEVASRRSFVKAAEALGSTQPATSRTIAQLEATLGVTLFERNRHGVRLTTEGEAFRHHAGAALASVQRGVSSVRNVQQHKQVLRIGALPTVAGGLVPAAVAHLREDGLKSRLRIVSGPQGFLVEELKNGRIDLLVGRMPPASSMESLSFERLYSEQIVLVARKGHPMCGPSASFVDLPRYPLVLPTPTAVIRPEVDRLLLGMGLDEPKDVIETVSPSFSLAFLQRTDAVWIISRSVVARALELGQVELVPLDTGMAFGPIGFSTVRAGIRHPLLQRLAESLRLCAQALIGRQT